MKKKTIQDLYLCEQPKLVQTIDVARQHSDAEKLDILNEIVEADAQLSEAKDGEKSAKAEWKARIDEIERERDAMVKRARDGEDIEPTECLVILNPKGKVKYFHDPETLERLETQPMTPSDYQTQLDFERESNGEA